MREGLGALLASARLEFEQLNRSRVLVALVIFEAITFLVLVSLFGLTGSRAPTALINRDGGLLARSFIRNLEAAHHSFALRRMSMARAQDQLSRGDLVAIIEIPRGFGKTISAGETAVLPITVDNVNADLTTDIREAIPSAITAFGKEHNFPGVRLAVDEHDLIDHETDYVAYLVASALVLAAFVVAGILGAVAITREFESRTITQWRLASVQTGYLLTGKLLTSACVSAVAVAAAALVVVFGYGVSPVNPAGAIGALAICVVIFTCLGACMGALFRRTLPVAALFFGLALPFYVDSGALEPLRFDGPKLWTAGHASPVYSAIALLQWGFHDLHVTPESVPQNLLILSLWAIASLIIAAAVLSRRMVAR
jgi:ABC-2 type transport system permease protein